MATRAIIAGEITKLLLTEIPFAPAARWPNIPLLGPLFSGGVYHTFHIFSPAGSPPETLRRGGAGRKMPATAG